VSTKIIGKVLSFEEQVAKKAEQKKKRMQSALSSLKTKLDDEAQKTLAKEEAKAKKLVESARKTADAQVRKVEKEQEKALMEAKARKTKAIAHPRMLAMWLARKYTRAAFSEISQYFGRRSHSTVISAQKKVTTWMSAAKDLQLANGDCSVDDVVRRVESRLQVG